MANPHGHDWVKNNTSKAANNRDFVGVALNVLLWVICCGVLPALMFLRASE